MSAQEPGLAQASEPEMEPVLGWGLVPEWALALVLVPALVLAQAWVSEPVLAPVWDEALEPVRERELVPVLESD